MTTLITNRRFQFVLGLFLFALVVPNVSSAFFLELGVMILQLFGRIVGFAGMALNIALFELVFQMGEKLNYNIGASVENAWGIVRDLMNLMFIFSLIYIGFSVILDFNSSTTRRLLSNLIIAALLVNFSLFFTKVIIDATNIAAVEIYQTIGWAQNTDWSNAQSIEEGVVNIGITGAFMEIMGLKGLIHPDQGNQNVKASYNEMITGACSSQSETCEVGTVDVLVYFFIVLIFFLVAAYAFAVGAFMLVWRFIVLVFLMIFSPVMFIGMIFPKAARYQSKWWNTFLYAAFYAPAYMLTLYIAFVISSRVNVFDNGDQLFNAVTGQFSSIDLILHFVIVIGFLLAAVKVGKEMSYYGSNGTMKLVDNMRRRGQRALAAATIGGAAYAGRQTVGKTAYATASGDNAYGERLQRLASGKGMRAWLARQQLAAASNTSKRSFDARQMMSKSAQNEVGAGYKGGYAQKIKDREKADKENAKLFGANDGQVYTDYGVEGQHKKYKEMEKQRATAASVLAGLANTPQNASERKRLVTEMATLTGQMKAMEKGAVVGEFAGNWEDYKKARRAEGKEPSISEESFNRSKQRLQEAAQQYANARKQEKGYGARRWAENQKTRYSGTLSKPIGWLFTDTYARKQGAKAAAKDNAVKGLDAKAKEVLKELSEGTSAAAEPPAAPEGGGDGTT